jgi:hypothetical protein
MLYGMCRSSLQFVMGGGCPQSLQPGVKDLINTDVAFQAMVSCGSYSKTYAGNESDEIASIEAKAGRVIELIAIPAALTFVTDCEFAMVMDRLTLAHRELFASTLLPGHWYTLIHPIDGCRFVRTLKLLSVANQFWVECEMYKLGRGILLDVFQELSLVTESHYVPAQTLVRPEHVIPYCTTPPCSSTRFGEKYLCSHRNRKLYFNSFYLK